MSGVTKVRVRLRMKRPEDVGRIHTGLSLEWSEHEIHKSTAVAFERGGDVEVQYVGEQLSATPSSKIVTLEVPARRGGAKR